MTTTPFELPLTLPSAPTAVEALQGPSDVLAHAGPAARRPFLAATSRAEIAGTEVGGVDRVKADGRPLLRTLRTGAGPCSTVLLGPRRARRELVGPGGTVLETLLAADRHPGIVAQWRTAQDRELALDVAWEVPGTLVAQRSAGAVLRVRPEHGADRLFVVHPAPTTWDLKAGPGSLRVRARVRAPEGRVSLLAGVVDADRDGEDLVRALAAAGVLEARADAFATGVRKDRLATRTGVGEIDDGLAWAVARTLDGGVRTATQGDSAPRLDALWTVIGSLAAGDPSKARVLLEPPPTDAAGVLALGWWVQWTGDTGLVTRHRDASVRILREAGVEKGGGFHGHDAVVRAAREGLALALEAAGEGTTVADLPEAPSSPTAGREGESLRGAGGVPLPMLDRREDAADDRTAVLAAVLGVPGAPARIDPTASPDTGVEAALRAWALFAAGHPEAAYRLLREQMARGMRTGAGIWPGEGDRRAPSGPLDRVAAALVPAALLHGLLGARAEAPWGRIRLAPSLPARWAAFEATGVRVADARVALRYTRSEGRHTFDLRQDGGRIPLTLLFEPTVPGAVGRVLVDGEPTDIAPAREADRSRIHVQLPLDAGRRVTLEEAPT